MNRIKQRFSTKLIALVVAAILVIGMVPAGIFTVLAVNGEPAECTVTVTKLGSDIPIAAATVDAVNTVGNISTETQLTDVNGVATFAMLIQGQTYTFNVSKTGYTSNFITRSMTTTNDLNRQLDVGSTPPDISGQSENTTDWAISKTVSATITASESGIDASKVFYSTDDKAISGTALTKGSGDVWTSDAITTDGTYFIYAYDIAGNKQVSSSITVDKIDTTAPTIANVTTLTSWGKTQKEIQFTVSDDESGVDTSSIVVHKGLATVVTTFVSTGVYEFTTTGNGTYTIGVSDNLGNATTDPVEISKIDTTPPEIKNITQLSTWFNTQQEIQFTVSDDDSGVDTSSIVVKKDGTAITAAIVSAGVYSFTTTGNGTYTIDVSDNSGNATTATDPITYIDTTKPTITKVTALPTTWANQQEIHFTISDSESGIDTNTIVVKNDGTPITTVTPVSGQSGVYEFTTTGNGTYTIDVSDNVGNAAIQNSASTTFIDSTLPTIASVTTLPSTSTGWVNTQQDIQFTVSDSESGINENTIVVKNDGTPITTVTPVSGQSGVYEFTTTGNGTYTIDVSDNVGNAAIQNSASTTFIDTSAPTATITTDTFKDIWQTLLNTISFGLYSNKTIDVKIDTSDAISGVANVWYYDSDSQMTLDGLKNLPDAGNTGWKPYSNKITIDSDRNVVVYVKVEDNARNINYFDTNGMIYDATKPVIQVTYDNNNAQNTNYYKAARTATITVTEHNWDTNGFTLNLNAENNSNGTYTAIALPNISDWQKNGDVYTKTIHYTADGRYTFSASCTDLAGNKTDVAQQIFYIDKTAPTVPTTIADIKVNSYVNGTGSTVAPVITVTDNNLDNNKVTLTLIGQKTGKVTTLAGNCTNTTNGRVFTFDNFSNVKLTDDIYTIDVTATDKAGNSSDSKALEFSVNRFGSTFDMSALSSVLGGYFKTSKDLVFNELNPNKVADDNYVLTLSQNGTIKELTVGSDYTRQAVETNGAWSQYTYTVLAKNFSSDGSYIVTLTSKDEANNENISNDATKDGKTITFAIDNTKPTATISGVDNGKSYNADSQNVTVAISDNLKLNNYTILLNGKEVSGNLLDDSDVSKKIELAVPSAFSRQNIKVTYVDAAGNQNTSEIKNFLINSNPLIRFYQNTALFFGSLAGLVVLILALAVFFLFIKKPKAKKA